MAMGMMKTIAKYMVKSMLWVTRIIESILETLEEKDHPNIERPRMNEAEVEPNENPIDQGRNEIPVRGRKFLIQLLLKQTNPKGHKSQM